VVSELNQHPSAINIPRQSVRVVKEADSKSAGFARTGSNPVVVDISFCGGRAETRAWGGPKFPIVCFLFLSFVLLDEQIVDGEASSARRRGHGCTLITLDT
jgi:hypothetical protein